MVLGSSLGGAAQAGSVDFGEDLSLNYKAVLNYGASIRTRSPAGNLVNGPIDPLVINTSQSDFVNGTSFTHTGLSTTINFDDGDRNFKKWSLINNRISALLEAHLAYKDYGLVTSADGFYDQTYHHPNDNDSPSTVNKTGSHTRFTDGARYYDGQRLRLLEAYAYGDFNLWDSTPLDLRVGKQLVAWGEALFFTGIALAQSPTDATKAFIPGAEVKDILLPVNQVSLQLGLSNELSLMAYYHLDYKADEIFPVGDFYSIQDAVGPGASFAYGSINPLYGNGCVGLFSSLTPAALLQLTQRLGFNPDSLCNLNGVTGPPFGASPTINSTRGPDLKPSKGGQWGVGGRYAITPRTTVGLFLLRYDDTTPAVVLNPGCAAFATRPSLTTCDVNEAVPTSYQVKYYDGIHLLGTTISTALGPFNISGEFNYRDHLDMPVQAMIEGELEPVYTVGKLGQADVSMIYTSNPGFLVDEIPIVAEAAYIHVFGVDPYRSSPVANPTATPIFNPLPNPIRPVGNGQQLFFSKNAWGYEILLMPKNHNVFSGVDLTYPITFEALAKGNPSMAGAFGALFGEGDQRFSVGLGATYLDNLEVGLAYNMFLGDSSKTIRGSDLHQHPYTDRDNLTFNVKYNF